MRMVLGHQFHVPAWLTMIAATLLGGLSQNPAVKASPAVGFVTGTVYYADTNLPARNASVTLDPWPTKGSGSQHSGWATTDLEGRFRSRGVPPGEYVVSADVDGYLQIRPRLLDDPSVRDSPEAQREIESRFTKVTVVANAAANVNLQIERGAEILGTVTYDDGSRGIGLTITFGRKKPRPQTTDHPPSFFGDPIPDYYTRTDDHGRFRIRSVFPGRYQISVIVPTYSAADPPDDITFNLDNGSGALRIFADGSFQPSRSRGVLIEEGDREKDVTITIPLNSLHTVQGTIVLKGLGYSPPAGVVQLLYADTRELARIGDARDGNFQLNYVPEGTYILRVAASSLPEFPRLHVCPPNCPPPLRPGFGRFAEVPLIVTGDVSDLVVTVPPPPSATP